MSAEQPSTPAQSRFYADSALAGEVTAHLVRSGEYVLQTHRLPPEQFAHVKALLDFVEPPRAPRSSTWDAGLAGRAAIMAMHRPDLRFTLQNHSAEQPRLRPPGFAKIQSTCIALRSQIARSMRS